MHARQILDSKERVAGEHGVDVGSIGEAHGDTEPGELFEHDDLIRVDLAVSA